jgi:membrane AbrB-like protein
LRRALVERLLPPRRRARLRRAALALAVGAAGGAFFDRLGFPLPWLTGPMSATTVAALAGLPVAGPGRLREIMVAVLGVMLGSAVTPNALAGSQRWIGSLGLLVLFVVCVTLSVGFALRRQGHGAATAYFAAAPGGLAEMVLMGQAMGGDDRTIALIHSVRLLVTVFAIPIWFRLFGGYAPGAPAVLGRVADLGPLDAAVFAACAVAGAGLAARLRVPAPLFIGPLLLSAAARLAGIVEAAPPREIVNLAQLVIGASVGCRFAGIPLTRLFGALLAGAGATLYMLALAAAFALGAAELTGVSFAAALLAFSPGGLPEMTLISLALGVDPAFVSTHHLLRIFVLYAAMPAAVRALKRGRPPPPASGGPPPPPR